MRASFSVELLILPAPYIGFQKILQDGVFDGIFPHTHTRADARIRWGCSGDYDGLDHARGFHAFQELCPFPAFHVVEVLGVFKPLDVLVNQPTISIGNCKSIPVTGGFSFSSPAEAKEWLKSTAKQQIPPPKRGICCRSIVSAYFSECCT